MDTHQLNQFLYQQIPLTQAMGVQIQSVNNQAAEVLAPLAINRNHLGSAFGGSLNAVLTLSCYVWLFHILEQKTLAAHVILRSNQTEYIKPVTGLLSAKCAAPDLAIIEKFLSSFQAKGLARITLHSVIMFEGAVACKFEGDFVAQRSPKLAIG